MDALVEAHFSEEANGPAESPIRSSPPLRSAALMQFALHLCAGFTATFGVPPDGIATDPSPKRHRGIEKNPKWQAPKMFSRPARGDFGRPPLGRCASPGTSLCLCASV